MYWLGGACFVLSVLYISGSFMHAALAAAVVYAAYVVCIRRDDEK